MPINQVSIEWLLLLRALKPRTKRCCPDQQNYFYIIYLSFSDSFCVSKKGEKTEHFFLVFSWNIRNVVLFIKQGSKVSIENVIWNQTSVIPKFTGKFSLFPLFSLYICRINFSYYFRRILGISECFQTSKHFDFCIEKVTFTSGPPNTSFQALYASIIILRVRVCSEKFKW